MGRLVLLKNIECPCCIGDPGHVFLAVCPQPRSGVFFQGFQQLVPPTWLIMELDLWWAGAGLYGLMRVDCFHIFPTVCSLRCINCLKIGYVRVFIPTTWSVLQIMTYFLWKAHHETLTILTVDGMRANQSRTEGLREGLDKAWKCCQRMALFLPRIDCHNFSSL